MKIKTGKNIRLYVQLFFFSLVLLISLSHNGIIPPILSDASVHAICPFGGVETFYTLVASGVMVKKIHDSAIVLAVASIILTVLFGPVLCGWICPLGSIQEWIGKLGKKLLGRKYGKLVPKKLDRVLRYLRYVVLIMVLFMTARTTTLMFEGKDPYYALFNFYNGEVALGALIILGLTMVMSLFIDRPWCRYACPYGAFLGIIGKFRIFKIKRNVSSCISCGICTKSCPMGIEVDKLETVSDSQCISCLECTSESKCPVPNTVELKVGMGK